MGAEHRALAEDRKTQRDINHAAKIDHYDDAWSSYAAAIEALITSRTSMGELLRAWDARAAGCTSFIPEFILESVDRISLGKFAHEKPPHRLVVLNGRYQSSREVPSSEPVIDVIAQCTDDEVDCVVEFGSGLGFNLARLRLRLPEAPLTYIACEPSAAGRHATRIIFSTDPAARLEDHFFDYCRPNLDFLSGFRKVVAFTMHSIEQVPELGTGFYRLLLDAPVAACVHVEPVGWQRFSNIAGMVLAYRRNEAAWRQFFAGYEFLLDDTRLVDNAAIWSTLCQYNGDLLRLISAAVASGEITVTQLAYDVLGVNPFNPSTLVAWRRNRR